MTTPYAIGGATRTDTGQVRTRNEDAVGAWQPVDPAEQELRGFLYVVCDGMGGHAAGDVAATYAVGKILHAYCNLPWEGPEPTLLAAIQEANADIHDEAERTLERRGMGCTVVAALVIDNHAIIAHVGDSRAYLIRGSSIRQLTRDHSWVAENLAEGVITPEQAVDHPNRNVLTRNLGQLATVRVDTTTVELQQGDRLLLCTDGLWNGVPDRQIARLAQRRDVEGATVALVEAANAAGGRDNIGVALIGIGPVSTGGTTTREPDTKLLAPTFASSTTARTRRVPAQRRAGLGNGVIVGAVFVALFAMVVLVALVAGRGGGKTVVPKVPTATALAILTAIASATAASGSPAGGSLLVPASATQTGNDVIRGPGGQAPSRSSATPAATAAPATPGSTAGTMGAAPATASSTAVSTALPGTATRASAAAAPTSQAELCSAEYQQGAQQGLAPAPTPQPDPTAPPLTAVWYCVPPNLFLVDITTECRRDPSIEYDRYYADVYRLNPYLQNDPRNLRPGILRLPADLTNPANRRCNR